MVILWWFQIMWKWNLPLKQALGSIRMGHIANCLWNFWNMFFRSNQKWNHFHTQENPGNILVPLHFSTSPASRPFMILHALWEPQVYLWPVLPWKFPDKSWLNPCIHEHLRVQEAKGGNPMIIPISPLNYNYIYNIISNSQTQSIP